MATDYEVGYKKPPKQSQFKQGQSGNPRGRPKGTKNLKTDLLEELGEQILVREGSRTRKISKQRAMLKNLIAQTLKVRRSRHGHPGQSDAARARSAGSRHGRRSTTHRRRTRCLGGAQSSVCTSQTPSLKGFIRLRTMGATK